jgi:hypothetical protein
MIVHGDLSGLSRTNPKPRDAAGVLPMKNGDGAIEPKRLVTTTAGFHR